MKLVSPTAETKQIELVLDIDPLLPELVNGYLRVPDHLRRDGLNGMSPDKQLVEGLNVVESELQRMSEQIASGDLQRIATQSRYLELKYQGME